MKPNSGPKSPCAAASPTAAPKTPAKPCRALLVGCGGISKAWVNACRDHFADRVELAGFVDVRPKAAEDFARECGGWSGSSLTQALAVVKPDVVFNCTVPEAHAAVCLEALRADCHVLTEKPLASNLDEAVRMIEAAQERNRTLAVIQNRRYHAPTRRVHAALASGIIGKVHTLNTDFFLGPRFRGFRETMQHVLLLDMAIHTFDSARFLSGLNACSVYAHEFNPSGSWFSHGASVHAIFEMTGGTVFNYRGSWCANGCATEWNSSWRFIGERGTLLWDGEGDVQVEVIDPSWDGTGFIAPTRRLEIPESQLTPAQSAHAGNIQAFLDCLDEGSVPETVATDNIKSLAMVYCAVQSAETGQKVAVNRE